jgi:hypothetical protein
MIGMSEIYLQSSAFIRLITIGKRIEYKNFAKSVKSQQFLIKHKFNLRRPHKIN